jgi:CRISPR-associated endonuclease/helicase Cas3
MERATGKAERLLQIEALLLEYPDGLSQAEIARRIGVNRSTVYRYLPDLTARFAVYETDDGRLAIDRDHYLMNVRLTLHESMAVHLAARLMATRTDKQNPHAAAALRKLGLALEKLAPRVAEHLKASAGVMEDQAQRHDPVYLHVLETLTRAWSDKRVAHLWHRMPDGRVFEYDFAPYFIEPYAVGQTTHVIGWRDPPDAIRTFKLERIQRIELTDREYTIPEDFNPREKLADAWGIWYTEEEPVEVVLKFHPRVAHRVRETQWHRSEQVTEQPDGSLLWRARVAEPQEMVPWIRGWGADVEVVEPRELRESLMNETRKLAAMYDIQPIPAYQLLWAKTSKDKTETHSLICHLVDVAQVTLALWDQSLPEATHRYFAQAMEMEQASARLWLAFVAGLHDLGKASPAFQAQHEASKQALLKSGLTFEKQLVRTSTPHGWVSTWALRQLLSQQLDMDQRLACQIAYTVGGHHGVFPTNLKLQKLGPGRRGGADWDAVRAELFNALADLLSVHQLPPWPESLVDDQTFWTMLAGLTSFADWLGSIEDYFFDLTAPDLGAYADLAYQQALLALDQLGWTGWSPPTRAAEFRVLFDFTPRPLQEAIVSLTEQVSAPALIIIEAPTGEGKTEAALYLADHWLQAEQQRGTYVAMPTQATSNQMLGRVKRFLEQRHAGQQVDLLLLHGNAAWSDDMEDLRLAAINEESDSTVVAHSWFLPKKRSFLAPFAVGTVDQALMSVLQTKHFFVRLFGLSHKTVIFDEIHAYDTYMSTLFQRLLKWLAAMGTPVILLSATLPDQTRRQLMEAYAGRPFSRLVPYPAISWITTEADGVFPVETSATGTRTLNVEWIDRQPKALVETLENALKEGGCAAVICNTVGRAQTVYQRLRDAQIVSPDNLILFHARFPLHQRQGIEKLVLDWFGKKDGGRPERAIVVATQVIEQSLDLDFDLMITDPAPVDLILQRAGRLHRHTHADRPSHLMVPRLMITKPEILDDLPQWGSDGWVYEPYVLLRSYLALRGRSKIAVPADVQPLVDAVYDDENPFPADLNSPLREALEQAYQAMTRKMKQEQYKARKNLIPPPDDEDVLSAGNRQLDEDNPELHETWRAMTRLTRPSVTLVCLHQQADGVALDLDGRRPVSLEERPGRELAAELARRTVTVSTYPVFKHFIDQDPPPGWSKHPLLRYYRAAIFTEGRIDLEDSWLILDPELGLMVEKKED